MKIVLTSGYSFQPANKKIDFTSILDFDIRRLLAVVHQPSSRLIYALGTPSLKGTFSEGVLTLDFNTTIASIYKPTDSLIILYDIAVQPISATTLPLPTGAAKDTTLVSILNAVAPIQNISTNLAKDQTLNEILTALDPLKTLSPNMATNATLLAVLQALGPLNYLSSDLATNTMITQINNTLNAILVALQPLQTLIDSGQIMNFDFSKPIMAGISPYITRI